MRRFLLLLPLLAGCAAGRPSLADVGGVAREVACTVCQATGGPSEQAAALAEALEQLTRAIAALAVARSPDEAHAILAELASRRDEQRARFERLLELAREPR